MRLRNATAIRIRKTGELDLQAEFENTRCIIHRGGTEAAAGIRCKLGKTCICRGRLLQRREVGNSPEEGSLGKVFKQGLLELLF